MSIAGKILNSHIQFTLNLFKELMKMHVNNCIAISFVYQPRSVIHFRYHKHYHYNLTLVELLILEIKLPISFTYYKCEKITLFYLKLIIRNYTYFYTTDIIETLVLKNTDNQIKAQYKESMLFFKNTCYNLLLPAVALITD